MKKDELQSSGPSQGVSRRTFVKGTLALTALSAAAAAGCAPGSVASAGNTSRFGKPSWVKRVDKYPVEIDDSALTRYDSGNGGFSTAARAWGPDLTAELSRIQQSVTLEGVRNNLPGNDLKARALQHGAACLMYGQPGRLLYSWSAVRPPTDYGVGPWQGSPEEAAQLVKAAALFYGAGSVGIARLDRRWIYSRDGGKDLVFEDVPEPVIEDTRKVIPEKVQYQISLAIPQSFELIALAPTAMSSAATGFGYSLMAFVAGLLAEFIRQLGYVAIPCGNDTGLSVPMAIDAGLGEVGRTGRLITPEWGPNVRLAKVLTDLPMAVDKPIVFGVMDFCRKCKKCAEHCPGDALSLETEPSWEITGVWNQPGKKVWQEDAAKCLKAWRELGTGCSVCVRVCPYTKRAETMLHDVVKGTISTMPTLSSFIAKADDWFGYGVRKDPDAWWRRLGRSFGRDGF